MSVKPYIFYKQSELETLRKNYEVGVSNWGKKWLSNESTVGVNNVTPLTSDHMAVSRSVSVLKMKLQSGTEVMLSCDDGCLAYLASCLLQKKSKIAPANARHLKFGKLEESLLHNVLQDLVIHLHELKTDMELQTEKLEPVMFQVMDQYHGHLLVSIMVGKHELELRVPPELTETLIARDYEAVSDMPLYSEDIKALLTTGSLRCEISLGTAQVSFEELVSLQVGDVIKLNSNLNDPCRLRFSGSSDPVKCILGKKEQNKAVKIV